MKRRCSLVVLGLSVSLVPAMAGAERRGFAGVAPAEAIVEQHSPTALAWTPRLGYDFATLVVVGPELRAERRFEPGSDLRFDLVDSQGVALADGRYKYELRLVSAVAAGRGEASPADADGARERPVKTEVVSGGFTIERGVARILVPDQEGRDAGSGEREGRDAESPSRAGTSDRSGQVVRGSDPQPAAVGAGHPELVENHFTGDIGATEGLCISCSAAYEPHNCGDSPGCEDLVVVDVSAGIEFVDAETSETVSWEISLAVDSLTFKDNDPGGADSVPATFEADAPTHTLYLDSTGNVGLGTSVPAARLDVVGNGTVAAKFNAGTLEVSNTAAVANQRFKAAAGAGGETSWLFQNNTTTSSFAIRNETGARSPFRIATAAPENQLFVGGNGVGIGTSAPAGKLDVNGPIYQRGTLLHADYVFQPDYQLESIEEHAAHMWSEGHLKAVPKAQIDEQGREVIELGAHQRGIVEELEKAHIYIAELSDDLAAKDACLADLQAENRQLAERLRRIEAALFPAAR